MHSKTVCLVAAVIAASFALTGCVGTALEVAGEVGAAALGSGMLGGVVVDDAAATGMKPAMQPSAIHLVFDGQPPALALPAESVIAVWDSEQYFATALATHYRVMPMSQVSDALKGAKLKADPTRSSQADVSAGFALLCGKFGPQTTIFAGQSNGSSIDLLAYSCSAKKVAWDDKGRMEGTASSLAVDIHIADQAAGRVFQAAGIEQQRQAAAR